MNKKTKGDFKKGLEKNRCCNCHLCMSNVTVYICLCCIMEDRQAMCLTMRLCCSSASEDLGCRRGDFSRKHYGSVELVSPIHNAFSCLLLSLCLSVTPHPLCPSSTSLILLMVFPPFLPLPVIAFPFFLLAWVDNRGGLMSHDVLGVVQQCALPT